VVWKFTVDALAGRSPVIYGDGSQSRDFVYVGDAVRATILAMERGRPGEAYDVGTGVSMPFNEVFRIVRDEMGFGGEAVHVPNPLRSYQAFTKADPSRAKKDLGFEPRYDLRAGVRELVRALRAGGPRASSGRSSWPPGGRSRRISLVRGPPGERGPEGGEGPPYPPLLVIRRDQEPEPHAMRRGSARP